VKTVAARAPDSALAAGSPESGLRTLVRAHPTRVAAVLLGAALVTWTVTIARMRGMDMGPGTGLRSIGWFIGVWVTMMAAMMLPSVAPMVLVFSAIAQDRARRGRTHAPTWVFVGGYFAAWTAFGVAAYAVYRLVAALDRGFLAWDDAGPYVAGGAIVLAGLYQLTPLKARCLEHCRTPLHFVLHDWREGRLGALRMGAEHGAYCVGCCWGLMLILFSLGVMSLMWMAIVAGVISAEKVLPFGRRLTRPLAVVFIALGIWVMAAPSTVPGLTQPAGGSRGMQMEPEP
jgi:predicted metal-binding membrane protein